MRKAGLAEEGEFSVENLVFKKLRNEGVIGKLMDIRKEDVDKELSLGEGLYANAIVGLEEMINTATTAMAPYPTPLAGQENPSKYEKQGTKREKKAMMDYKYKKNRTNSFVPVVEEILSVCEEIGKNKSAKEVMDDMGNDINTFFSKADEFIKKQKEREAKLKDTRKEK